MHTTRLLSAVLAISLFLAAPSMIDAAHTQAEQDFVVATARSADVELRAGQMAVYKAAHRAVRDFGQRMVDANAPARERIHKLAAAKHVDLPSQPSDKQIALLERLQGLSGADFDRAYMAAMVDMHHHDVKVLEELVKQTDDADIKAYAVAELPILREHLQLARDVADTIGAPLSPLALASAPAL